ncbi:MAG: thymidylate kinase [Gammaproteobacteria bacterium]|nr:MAG: thymidylate kinase [Gammaproteobacteria bacterium]
MESSMESETQSSQQVSSRQLGFEFKGNGMEYFKIWIVNVLLTIITLGIYSAWAKVRSNRYFYSNLYLDDSNFRYLAEPMTILKGRLIAVAALIVYSVVTAIAPMIGIVLLIALFFAIPYFINQSIAFNNRMSAYKNIQFRFSASYGEAFMVMYVWPIIGILTLGILYPMALLKMHQYVVKNSAYGTTKFEYSATYKDYGMIFLMMIGIIIAAAIIIGIISTLIPALAPLSLILIAVMYIGIILYSIVAITNLFYHNLGLVEHRFKSTLTIMDLGKVMLINLFFIIITLGLYLPAAKVRMTKYMCSCLVMDAEGSLDDFAAAEKENVSALGEEFGQVFDFGI